MKRMIAKVALTSLLLSGVIVAGKNVAPVEAPVAPVVDINPFYIGLGLLWSGTSRDCLCDGENNVRRLKNTSYGFIGRIGYDFNPYIGIEARAFKASIDSNFADTTHYGIYMKPQYHVTDKLNIYGLIGYGQTKIDCNIAGTSMYDEAGASFGFGFEYDMSDDETVVADRTFDGQGDQEKGWGIWVDYQNFLNDEGSAKIKSNIVTAGVTYDF
jgi:OOP family OmpA-OmpF porin